MNIPARYATIFAVSTALLTPLPSPAEEAGMALPIYPHTHYAGSDHRPMNDKAAAHAVVIGAQTELYTGDSIETVDRWYQARMPKSCARAAYTDTHMFQYTCATRRVIIVRYQTGDTHILLGPKL